MFITSLPGQAVAVVPRKGDVDRNTADDWRAAAQAVVVPRKGDVDRNNIEPGA